MAGKSTKRGLVGRTTRSVGKKKRSVGRTKRSVVSEHSEQVEVVRRLKRSRVLFCSVPNGGKRSRGEAAKMVREGLQRGVPDLLIFDAPPGVEGKVGTALEMKKAGAPPSSVRPEQKRWLKKLEDAGWWTIVGYGAEDAFKKLKAAGYVLDTLKPRPDDTPGVESD